MKTKKYCKSCGKKLQLTKTFPGKIYFDEYTGQKQVEKDLERWECPDYEYIYDGWSGYPNGHTSDSR